MQLEVLYKKYLHSLSGIYDRSEAEAITLFIFEEWGGYSKNKIFKEPGFTVPQHLEEKFLTALEPLLNHKPVQQVTGICWFYNLKLFINEHVLVPRPETEELVDYIVKENKNKPPLKVLDIGTGSGCIALAVKKLLPQSTVTGIDISDEALTIASKNASALGAEILFKQSDFLNETTWSSLGKYDIIISNPPYIPIEEKMGMDENVTRYEPSLALFAPGDDPLIFYRKMLAFSLKYLNENGSVYMETHKNYARAVGNIFMKNPSFKHTEVLKDISGNERMVKAIHCP